MRFPGPGRIPSGPDIPRPYNPTKGRPFLFRLIIKEGRRSAGDAGDGVAMLVLDGRLPADEALIAQVISRDRNTI